MSSPSQHAAPIIKGNLSSPNACIIWLHGLGADASDFAPIVEQLNFPGSIKVKFIFPNAPQIPVTINARYIMPAWYDILELTEERVINEEQLYDSVNTIHSLIDAAIASGIDSARVILIGFSQGGAVAYHAGLSYPKRLGGIIGLSTYFPQTARFNPHPANAAQSVFICHGDQDPMVILRQGQRSAQTLEQLGHHITFSRYTMEHEVCLEEIRDIEAFIIERLKGCNDDSSN